MKRILPLVIIAVIAVFTVSCNKSYTCTCTVTTQGVSHVISADYDQVTKGDAKDRCSQMQLQYVDSANSVASDCHL